MKSSKFHIVLTTTSGWGLGMGYLLSSRWSGCSVSPGPIRIPVGELSCTCADPSSVSTTPSTTGFTASSSMTRVLLKIA